MPLKFEIIQQPVFIVAYKIIDVTPQGWVEKSKESYRIATIEDGRQIEVFGNKVQIGDYVRYCINDDNYKIFDIDRLGNNIRAVE